MEDPIVKSTTRATTTSFIPALPCMDKTFASEFEEFVVFCSDNICCPPMQDYDFATQQCHGCNNCMSEKAVRDDHEIVANNCCYNDPQDNQFRKEMRAMAPDLPHLGSCDSSLSSQGSLASGMKRNNVRVCFDAHLATAEGTAPPVIIRSSSPSSKSPPLPPTRYPAVQAAIADDTQTVVTEGERSARFNDALNTTIEYIPDTIPDYRRRHRRDIDNDDDDGIKSEGGEVRWTKPSNKHKKSTLSNLFDKHRFDHRVLGTSTKDRSAKPHVLSIMIMDEIQEHLPLSKRGEFCWLKYSLIRDGAGIQTMLHKTRTSDYTILAVETTEGEKFGAFVGKPWRNTWSYYGSPVSFLWRVGGRHRQTPGVATNNDESSEDSRESEHLEVFPYGGQNAYVQFCQDGRLAVGGGSPPGDDGCVVSNDLSHVKTHEWGFGLAFEDDLQYGTSSPCMTFASPALSTIHQDGSRFEVSNLEIWTLTPASSVATADMIQKGRVLIDDSMTV